MSFLTAAALAIGLLVAVPFIAHMLRRRPPREQHFAATHLVPTSPAETRRKTAIEDRTLFGIRALAVLALAILGATPFVQCDRLSLARKSGASVALAIVIDDSLSMQAAVDDQTRFDKAIEGAEDLIEGLEPGDAVAIVMAGKPTRVVLAATTNRDSALDALAEVAPSDRGTDLETALATASELLAGLEHIDKRIVLLSDMAYAGDEAALEAAAGDVPLWAPLDGIRGVAPNCAVIQADRSGGSVLVRVGCAGGEGADRKLELRVGDEVITDTPLRIGQGVADLTLPLGETDDDEPLRMYAVLTGKDALPGDDRAPVLEAGGSLRMGVVSDSARTAVATGGPPPVEQALKALRLGVHVQPLASVPERKEELEPLQLMMIDDVQGLTPAERRTVSEWVRVGGVLFLTLGPRAASAPLGSSFRPMLPALVRWATPKAEGIDVKSDRLFGKAASGLANIEPRGRAELDLGGEDALEVLTRWSDEAPFILRHRMGRGVVLISTLPLSSDDSDFALRPAFLVLLSHLVDTARSLGGATRTAVGSTWTFPGIDDVSVSYLGASDEGQPQTLTHQTSGYRFAPARIGLYEVKLAGNRTQRVASADETEIDLTPIELASAEQGEAFGTTSAPIDVSRYVALVLLGLLVLELALRIPGSRRRPDLSGPDPSGPDSTPTSGIDSERPAADSSSAAQA